MGVQRLGDALGRKAHLACRSGAAGLDAVLGEGGELPALGDRVFEQLHLGDIVGDLRDRTGHVDETGMAIDGDRGGVCCGLAMAAGAAVARADCCRR